MPSVNVEHIVEVDDHDRGLTHDLEAIDRMRIGRRRALFWLGSASGIDGSDMASNCDRVARAGRRWTNDLDARTIGKSRSQQWL
jgi:hypothetical protein